MHLSFLCVWAAQGKGLDGFWAEELTVKLGSTCFEGSLLANPLPARLDLEAREIAPVLPAS